jgi:hypothetical protein
VRRGDAPREGPVSEIVLLTLMGAAGIAIAGCIGWVLAPRGQHRGAASAATRWPATNGSDPGSG